MLGINRELDDAARIVGYICTTPKVTAIAPHLPISSGAEHKALAQDMPAFFREATQEAGTRPLLYYGIQIDGTAGLRHPE